MRRKPLPGLSFPNTQNQCRAQETLTALVALMQRDPTLDYNILWYPTHSSQTHTDFSIPQLEMTVYCKAWVTSYLRKGVYNPAFFCVVPLWDKTSGQGVCVCTAPSTMWQWSLMEPPGTSEIQIKCSMMSFQCLNSCADGIPEQPPPRSSCPSTMGSLPWSQNQCSTLTIVADKAGMARNTIWSWQSIRPHRYLFLFAESVRQITL